VKIWKALGLAGSPVSPAGVAATESSSLAHQRKRSDLTPSEIRAQPYERLATDSDFNGGTRHPKKR